MIESPVTDFVTPTQSSVPASTSWSVDQIVALYEMSFPDLLYRAHSVHRQHHDPNDIQLSTLLSIKTGACPEDCAYCPQSSRHDTNLESEPLMPLDEVVAAAKAAKENGARRFCMGAAWRSPSAKQVDDVAEMIRAVKDLGLETCVTLGMLKAGQAE